MKGDAGLVDQAMIEIKAKIAVLAYVWSELSK
jgi:hypothetical protein